MWPGTSNSKENIRCPDAQVTTKRVYVLIGLCHKNDSQFKIMIFQALGLLNKRAIFTIF